MVEDIESLHSQLQIERIRDSRKPNVFDERQIDIDQAWTDELIAPLITFGIQTQHLPIGGGCSSLVTEWRDR